MSLTAVAKRAASPATARASAADPRFRIGRRRSRRYPRPVPRDAPGVAGSIVGNGGCPAVPRIPGQGGERPPLPPRTTGPRACWIEHRGQGGGKDPMEVPPAEGSNAPSPPWCAKPLPGAVELEDDEVAATVCTTGPTAPAHSCSCHSLRPLVNAAARKSVQVALASQYASFIMVRMSDNSSSLAPAAVRIASKRLRR
jgi:hypothetical protein